MDAKKHQIIKASNSTIKHINNNNHDFYTNKSKTSRDLGIKKIKPKVITINEKGVVEEEAIYTTVIEESSKRSFILRLLAIV